MIDEAEVRPEKSDTNMKRRKVVPSTPPKERRLNDNDITAETILKSPQKQSSTYFNSSNNLHNNLSLSSQINNDINSNQSSRGRSILSSESISQVKTQEVSPFRRLSPTRKGRSESPTNSGKRFSLVQLSPRRKNNKLQQLNHAIERENLNIKTGGRRLYISKLTLTNFKSYANEQVIGPFNENFTAVIGPNGSGKSNVIDSMLFVFGFRANKLRQGKLSELIHKSETYPDLGFCSVDVHFKYNFTNEIIANQQETDELVVTRKAFKNNSSKYYVNGKESTYAKVTELLKKEGIDLDHKRFLILQGEVESIAQMKPKAEKEGEEGILEYLEDIIGTSKYKGEIDTSLTNLESLNEICFEKDNRLKIVEREMKSLEAGKDASIVYLKLEREYVILKSNLIQHKKLLLGKNLNEITFQKNEVGEKLKTAVIKETEIKDINTSLKKNISENLKVIKELKDEEKIIDDKISSLSKKKIEAEENKKNHQKTQDKNKSTLDSNKKLLESLEREINKSKVSIEESLEQTENLLVKINNEKSVYQTEKTQLQEKSTHLSQQITALEQEIEPAEQRIAHLESESALQREEVELIHKRKETSSETVKILENKKVIAERKFVENESEIKKVLSSLSQIQETIKEKETKLIESEKSYKNLHESYLKQKQVLTEAKNLYSFNENSSKVIKALFKLQEQGRIKGFHGRLGDLGVINAKYDIAISTAAPRLNDILVDTVECAQTCIEYLRSNHLGYARFILLDKLPNFNNGINQSFEFLPDETFRLFDLIHSADKLFLPAFYSVMRDTIVTNSLGEANKIAYGGQKRYRVVTRDGKLIDISGTMSGGGRQKFKGLMRLNNETTDGSDNKDSFFMTSVQINNMEQKFKNTEEEYESNSFIRSETLNIVEKIKSEIPDMQIKQSTLQFETESLKSEIESYEKQLRQLKKQENSNDILAAENITKLMAAIENNNNEILLIKDKIKPNTFKINDLKEKINKLGGFELENKFKFIATLESEKNKVEKFVKKHKISIKKNKAEIERLKKNNDKLAFDLNSATNNLSFYNNVITDCNNRIDENISFKESVSQRLKKSKIDNDELTSDVLHKEQILLEVKKEVNDLNAKLDDLNDKIKKVKVQLNQQDALLAELKIRDAYESLKILNCLPKSDSSYMARNEDQMDVEMDAEKEDHNLEHEISEKMLIEDNADKQQVAIPEPPVDFMSHTDYLKLPILLAETSDEMNPILIEEKIEKIKHELDSASVNIASLEDYVVKFKSFKLKEIDLNEALQKKDEIKEQSEQLKKQRYDEFIQGFNIISQSLKEMYQMITMGGNAELELVDSLDPFSEGILFSVMPPKKSWRNISNLSGGEKTLSSLALVFALHNYKPTPIYIMDEIDAALDFKNVSIVANYIKDKTKDAQFVVISLRDNMFELSERLIGIYKNQNMTRSTTLENVDFIHS
ncbi:hypothetical protein QEN19_001809 [Hanseniaspora menglaensis]